jgi:hypothetical protein
MDVGSLTVGLVYGSAVALDAMYIDAGGAQHPVRVLPDQRAAEMLSGPELAVRGSKASVRVRISELPQPQVGERFVLRGETLRIDARPVRLNPFEWVIDVA